MRLLALVGVVSALVLSFAAPASAQVVVNDSSPIALLVFIPCADDGAGELVLVEGDLHTLITFTVNGNNVSGKTHFQPQGVSGTGLTTGDTYRGTGVTQDHFKGSLQNGQFTQTFVNNFRIIGHGPGNNLLIHENFHLTINASGDVTVVHDNFRVECK
jgi:hypothetical protein